MRIGLFSDAHYSSQKVTCNNRYNNRSLAKIKQAFAYFNEKQCDLIICLGDLIDSEDTHEKEIENLKQIANIILKQKIKTYVLMGNHDAFLFTKKEFYDILGNNMKPKNFTIDNKKFIFIDACYFNNKKHYQPKDSDWTNSYINNLSYLKKIITNTTSDCYIFIHQNVDEAIDVNHKVKNEKAFNKIISQCHNVKMIFQGHYHLGNINTINNVSYITLKAMCEGDNRYYIYEI